MKTKPNKSIKALRKIICKTQAGFATSIGVSKDAVVSWENGRNKLSPRLAKRIRTATGATVASLLRGDGRVTYTWWWTPEQPYIIEHYKKWVSTYLELEDVERETSDQLHTILIAASKPGIGSGTKWRLLAVYDSFLQWAENTRNDFKLGPQIDAILSQRKAALAAFIKKREAKCTVTVLGRPWSDEEIDAYIDAAILRDKESRHRR